MSVTAQTLALPRPSVTQAARLPRRTWLTGATDFLICLFFCSVVAAGFAIADEDLIHWCILPIVVSGALIGVDGLDWLRGKVDIFDPAGILGILGVHFFFLAPLLHIFWEMEMSYVDQPPDWREWIGAMAGLNCVSLVFYRIGLQKSGSARDSASGQARLVWLPSGSLLPVLIVSIAISLALQVWIYAQFGGIGGLVETFAADGLSFNGTGSFGGMGWMFIIAENFSNLLMVAVGVFCRYKRIRLNWLVIFALLAFYLVVRLLFGGLRGSRSHTIWGLFWAVGIIHFWVRPITRKMVLVGLAFLFLFMYVYGFYKAGGIEALEDARNEDSRQRIETRSGKTFSGLLLGDLARSDVQAYLLYRLYGTPSDYHYCFGRTYFGAISLVVPKSVWPNRPPTKLKEGTEIQYGSGTYDPGPGQPFFSSRVYGLAGELILNFGPIAVPFGFLLLGLYTGKLRQLMRRLHPADVRWLLVPLLISFSFAILTSDSDNLFYLFLKELAIPAAVLFIGSSRVPLRPQPAKAR